SDMRVPVTDPVPAELYTLSLHDALPIYGNPAAQAQRARHRSGRPRTHPPRAARPGAVAVANLAQNLPDVLGDGRRGAHQADSERSEEHTSELQSQSNLVCRLLLEKKK